LIVLKPRLALSLTSAALFAAALAGALRGLHAGTPADLPELARRAEVAGWRVVAVSASTADPRGGFYAVPPGDPRGWEDVSRLRPGGAGGPPWAGAVLCLPGTDAQLLCPPAYSSPGYILYGEGGDVLTFAEECGLP